MIPVVSMLTFITNIDPCRSLLTPFRQLSLPFPPVFLKYICAMHYVSVEGLGKSYGIKPLFEDISLHISEGDKIALIARNGSGKSTLLKILAGKETPDSGTVWINKEVTVALFEQEPVFKEDLSVLDNIF